MREIYLYSNIIYEISLYLLIYQSYIDGEEKFVVFLLISLVISTFLSAVPSTLHVLKYPVEKRNTQIDGFIKVLQYFILFYISPLTGLKYIGIILSLMLFLSILNLLYRYQTLKELQSVALGDFSDRIDKDLVTNDAKHQWTQVAWKTLIPFFLLALIDGRNIYFSVLIYLLILIFEFRIIKVLYEMAKQSQSAFLLKRFKSTVFASVLIFILLVASVQFDKTKMLRYFIMGMFSMVYVSLRSYYKKEQSNE